MAWERTSSITVRRRSATGIPASRDAYSPRSAACDSAAPVVGSISSRASGIVSSSGRGRAAEKTGANLSHSTSAIAMNVSSSARTSPSVISARSVARKFMPWRRSRLGVTRPGVCSSMASTSSQSRVSHTPQAMDVPGRPRARRSSASASRNELPAA